MTGWFFQNLAWATLLMLVVLAVRRPFAAAFGAGPAYALWLLPALRLAMPPLQLPAFASTPQTVLLWVEEAAAPLPSDAAAGQWLTALLALWAIGTGAFLVWQWRAYRRFLTELSLSSRSLGAHRGIPLLESAAVQGPLALGLLDRRIVVPADFASRYSLSEQSLALDHECIHHRRGDIWWNHAGLLILALNWFNPIAWLAFRAFRTDQELACDAAVAAAASPQARHDYARALIKSASPHGLIAACPLNHANQLKRRLKMMKGHRNSRLRMIGGATAVAILAAAGLTLGAPGLAHPHPEGEKAQKSERIIIRTHQGGAEDAAGHGDHRVHVRRIGPDGEAAIPDCEGGARTDVDEGSDGERTRIVLCSRGDATPAQRAEHLQRSRERLANDSDLSAEQRARITAALDREIARLRGQ